MLTILIVEDDPMVSSINKQYLMRIIKPENLTVYQTATAKKALAITKNINPDLILLDVYLPKTSGTELLEQFIQHNLHPNVIMLSAAKDSTNINMALKYGVLDYLLKPFSFKRFKEAIEHFLKYNKVLQKNNTVSQGELDHIFITQDMNNLNDETGLPKGLSDFSLTKIETAISQLADEFSNQDVARQSKLSRITTKKYLDYLEKTGKLSTKVHYLKVGRPIKIYKLNK
ncbi:response regulator [uncultured Lactobacillus sp.]|uniref:response regulator n=1 Tax=uncultured Lactobacillus sp. TaxID=153152 RepID=UPI0025F84997|nr:response regulator [uncultured Lactobacillus sp.]